MKRTITFTLLTLALTVALVAQPGPGRGKQGPDDHSRGDKLVRCLTILDLNEDQRTQIRGILESSKPEIEVLHEEGRALREALRAAVEANADSCAVGAAFLAVQDHREEVGAFREEIRESIFAALSPEQQQKLSGCLEAPGRQHDDR